MVKRFNKSSIAITITGAIFTIGGLLLNFFPPNDYLYNLAPDIFSSGLVFGLVPFIKWMLDLFD